MRAQLPVFVASCPVGVNFSCERFERKNPYGEPWEAFCHSRVGNFVEDALGYHEFQSGSSATFESIPIAWRFFVMIWFDATQSDQPEITWMSSETGLPLGSMRLLPLYVNPASVSIFFAAVGLYVAAALACALTDGSVTQPGNSPPRPMPSTGGAYPYSPSFDTE